MKLVVISDIHSDLRNLEKAMKKIKDSGYDRLLCLGDIVGYSYHYAGYLDGRDPDACIQLVQESCDFVIRGNHDLHAILTLPPCHGELGIPANWYELDLDERARISEGRFWLYDDELKAPLRESSLEYIRDLPDSLVIRGKKFDVLATHFIWPDTSGCMQTYPAALKDFRGHLKLIRKQKCLTGIAGHAHLDGYAQVSKKALGMNYYRKGKLVRSHQVIVVPAITRRKGSSGYLVLDTESYIFEAILI
jgi:predicted phosphodiesterase